MKLRISIRLFSPPSCAAWSGKPTWRRDHKRRAQHCRRYRSTFPVPPPMRMRADQGPTNPIRANALRKIYLCDVCREWWASNESTRLSSAIGQAFLQGAPTPSDCVKLARQTWRRLKTPLPKTGPTFPWDVYPG